MESASPESNPCILAIDQEDPAARFLRVGAAFLVAGVLSAVLYALLRDDRLVLSLCLGLAALLWLSARWGRRPRLVLRSEVLFTVHLSDPILRHAQIGIDLVATFQNRGIGSEALRVLIEFFRRDSSLLKISAGCFADNLRCRRALEKAGMRLCGSETMFWMKEREWKDGLLFECVLSESEHAPPA